MVRATRSLVVSMLLGVASSCAGPNDPTTFVEATGLEWQREVAPLALEQPAAVTYCDELELAGQSDWRLPTIRELRSLVDVTRFDPALDTRAFPPTNEVFWTSTNSASGANRAWNVAFWDGTDGTSLAEGIGAKPYVRCVRGDALPPHVFTANADGTTSDLIAGLLWERQADPDPRDYAASVAYCASLSLGGLPVGGWRVPTFDELATLVDYTRHTPAIESGTFRETQSITYWSSTPYAATPGRLWGVNFDDGAATHSDPVYPNRVRCVR